MAARKAIIKGHNDFVLKVEYVLFLSKTKSPQSADDKLRAIGPYKFELKSLDMYLLRLYFNLPMFIKKLLFRREQRAKAMPIITLLISNNRRKRRNKYTHACPN